MIKYVSPAGWDWDRPIAIPLKYSSRGLIGADRADFIKVAGHIFLPQIDSIKVARDEVPVHLIALGASEAYGPNRNGDAFPELACIRYYPTFTKFARFYRNHKNKPEQGHPHYGIVKAAAYNKAMRRVELLALLNAEKSACDRNGGLLADLELEKLAKDGDMDVSMACRVPNDECSFCHHLARTRKEYCTSEKCAAGGCRDNLTRVVKVAGDMHHLHVVNRHPTWFDISKVFRRADRIALGGIADYLDKAAADGMMLALEDMYKMAEDATAPLEVIAYQDGMPGEWNLRISGMLKLAYGLAAVEPQEARRDSEVYRAFAEDVQRPFNVEALGQPGTEKCAAALGALADRKIVLPLRDFSRLAGKQGLAKEAAQRLPGIYQRMIDDGSLDRRVEQNKFPVLEKLASVQSRTAANLGAEEYSLDKEAVRQRSMLSAMRGCSLPGPKTGFVKESVDNGESEQLARDYAIYKIAALQRIAAFDSDFGLTARMAIRQNYVY